MTTKPDPALAVAESIAAQASTEDGRTPLERVLVHRWPTITAWRAAGWTWRQIAALLTRGGVRLKNGAPLTDKYLAAVASRANRAHPETAPQGGSVLTIPATGHGPLKARDSPSANISVNKSLKIDQAKPMESASSSPGQDRRDEIRERMRRASQSRIGN